MILTGQSVSKGIVIGNAFRYEPYEPHIEEKHFLTEQSEDYLNQYFQAKERAHNELVLIRNSLMRQGSEEADIFTAHIEILMDEETDVEICRRMKEDHLCPDSAVSQVYTQNAELLAAVEDSVIRERAIDVRDVGNRLLRILNGVEESKLSSVDEPSIVVAYDLLPSDTATMDRKNVIGIICENGSYTSHAAIIARSFGIPAILGVEGLMEYVVNKDRIVLDALSGLIDVNPGSNELDRYIKKGDGFRKYSEEISRYLNCTAKTTDGCRIQIGLNIADMNLTNGEFNNAVDMVGLFRTEFLYMNNRHLPTREEQFQAYSSILKTYNPKPVVLRTLDIGGDKTLPYLPLPHEDNPFLGCRAIRLCFEKEDLFRTQLKAALEASVNGNLWIMFPMVTGLEDIRKARNILNEVKADLDHCGIVYAGDIKIGVMIEIPSIAIIADRVALEVDFASIGSNDLCQYMTASDRLNPRVSQYYQSFHPAMFKTIKMVIDAFDMAEKPLSLCGEIGSNPKASAVLIGLGIRKISVGPSSLAEIKKMVSTHSLVELEKIADDVMKLDTEEEIIHYLEKRI